ncbi:hypothetical protein HNP00_003010 [Arthrobacter sp. AZCC_0090]|nr:hypothetical protein [Arthrobacter sp. AZCC_0090]
MSRLAVVSPVLAIRRQALRILGALRGWWGIEFVALKTIGPVALLG